MSDFPLTPFENKARTHGWLSFFGFFVALPIGVGIARYARTFFGGWLYAHMFINLVVSGPLIFAGFAYGHQTTSMSGLPHYQDAHQKGGLALLILYIIQLVVGIFIHWIKVPRVFTALNGHRPQNLLHILIGIAILALASWQTHYGLYTEYPTVTGNIHPIGKGWKDFWIAMVVIVWVLYAAGMALLPRQLRLERNMLQANGNKEMRLADRSSPSTA